MNDKRLINRDDCFDQFRLWGRAKTQAMLDSDPPRLRGKKERYARQWLNQLTLENEFRTNIRSWFAIAISLIALGFSAFQTLARF
jgi:hypothetical protein